VCRLEESEICDSGRIRGTPYSTLVRCGDSKKVENLAHAVSLHFMYYNFCRVHQTLRVTPAMEAGITDHVWSLEAIANLIN
jgi:hypothetical protein